MAVVRVSSLSGLVLGCEGSSLGQTVASLSVSIAIVAITIVVLVALVGVVVQAKTDCADVMGMSNMVPGTSGK
jgi:hypothetical protein